jgi:hypothetical protein
MRLLVNTMSDLSKAWKNRLKLRKNVSVDFNMLLSKRLIFLLSCFAGATYTIGWIGQSYFDVNFMEVISFIPNDGTCPYYHGVFGVHCFGDFSGPILGIRDIPNPWDVPFVYTPAGALVFYLFSTLGFLFNSLLVSLFFYLILLTVCLISPIYWASKNFKSLSPFLLLVVGIMTTPFLSGVDRANTISISTLFLLYVSINFYQQNLTLLLVFITLCAVIKPHYIILAILFLVLGKRVFFVYALIVNLIVQVLATLILVKSPIQTWSSILDYWSTFNANEAIGVQVLNISIYNSIYNLMFIFDSMLNLNFGDLKFLARLVSYLLILICIIFVLFFGNKIPTLYTLVFVFTICSFFVNTTFIYYTNFAIVICALILREPESHLSYSAQHYSLKVEHYRILSYLLVFIICFTLYHLPISTSVIFPQLFSNETYSVSRLLVSPLWFFWCVITMFTVLLKVHKGKCKSKKFSAVQ